MIAAGGLMHGVYFMRSAGLLVIRTTREPEVVVSVVGDRATLPDGSVEVRRVTDAAGYARWACVLAAEVGVGIEMRVTTTPH